MIKFEGVGVVMPAAVVFALVAVREARAVEIADRLATVGDVF